MQRFLTIVLLYCTSLTRHANHQCRQRDLRRRLRCWGLACALAMLPGFSIAQTLDIGAMLDAAERIESPLARPFICGPEAELLVPQSANNGVLSLSINRVCLSYDGDPVQLVVEGRIVNPDSAKGMDVLPAWRLFHLRSGPLILDGDAAFEARMIPNFAAPLGPLASRAFAVSFPLTQARADWEMVHPAQAGQLAFSVAKRGALITGEDLPGVMLPPASTAKTDPPATRIGQTKSEQASPETTSEPPAPTPPMDDDVTCFPDAGTCSYLAASTFVDDIPDWFSPSENTGPPRGLLGPPGAGSGMEMRCGGEVVANFSDNLLVDRPGTDLKVFSDPPLNASVLVYVARTSERWQAVPPTDEPGAFDIGGLADLSPGFDLVRLVSDPGNCDTSVPAPSIKAIAAVFGQDWIRVERRDGYSDLAGFPISRASFGGAITRLDRPSREVDPIFLSWDADGLIDGNTYSSFRVHSDAVDQPSSFAVTFAGGRSAKIAAVRIHSEESGGFTFHPGRVAIYASRSGISGPWELVGLPQPANDDVSVEEFRFASPVTANAIRIDFHPREPSSSYRGAFNQSVAEIEVVEIEGSDAYTSVTDGVTINAIDPQYGGHLVSFTSQLDEDAFSASSTLDKPDQTFWQAETDVLPQELVYAFSGHDIQSIDRFTAVVIAENVMPEDWAPVVRVEVSVDVSPLLGFHPVGNMRLDPASGQLVLDLPQRTEARYVRLVVVDPGGTPYGITLATAQGQLSRYLGAEQVGYRASAEGDLGQDTESEPQNDSTDGAEVLVPGLAVTGRPNSNSDVDFYRIDVVEPGISAITLTLEGLPRIKVNVTLLDEAGTTLAETPATGTATKRKFTWTLEQGTYYVRLSQAPASIAMFIDNSGSLGPAIYDALDAADGFIAGKTPAEQISLFSFAGPAQRLVDRTADTSVLHAAIEDWRSSPDAGRENGTAVFDSIMDGVEELKNATGNKAIVIFTDGADASSQRTPSVFWDEIDTIDAPVFLIGYGADMQTFEREIGAKSGDGMRAIALATEGAFYEAPTPLQLPDVFAQIAERVRERSGYRVSYEVSPGLGELEVLEVGEQMVASGVLENAIIIFDASGSMKARTDAGRQRINVARSVLFDLLAQIPEEVPMGLWLYGHSLPSEPKSQSCRDAELLVAPHARNRAQIRDVAKAIAPKGQTPIGYTLSQAGDMLSGARGGLVILLTDGEETCDAAPDATYNPDRVVTNLVDRGVDLRVNIVGFDVSDPKIQRELASVAKRTGGEFFYGEGQEGLRTALKSAFTAPVDVIDDTGRVVASGLVGSGPIELPEGNYRIRIAGTDFVSNRQSVLSGRATRLFLSQEASAVRVRVEDVQVGAPYASESSDRDAKTEAVPPEFDPDARVPETMEELIFKTQDLLAKLGYDPGPLDGAMGSKTRRASQAFLEANGPLPAGEPFDGHGNPTLLLWFELFAARTEQMPTN